MRAMLVVFFLLAICFSDPLVAPSMAGQVVTPETKTWAHEMLKSEKNVRANIAPRTVAVLYFKNVSTVPDLDPLEKGLAIMLTTDLSKVNGLNVVERIKLQALIDEMNLEKASLVSPGTSATLGGLLGAQWLLGGVIDKAELLEVDSKILDVRKEKALKNIKASGNMEALFKLEKQMVGEVVGALKIHLTAAQKVELQKPLSTNSDALFSFFKGVDMSDKGNYDEAGRLYQKALMEDAALVSAQEALAELSALGLLSPTIAAEMP